MRKIHNLTAVLIAAVMACTTLSPITAEAGETNSKSKPIAVSCGDTYEYVHRNGYDSEGNCYNDTLKWFSCKPTSSGYYDFTLSDDEPAGRKLYIYVVLNNDEVLSEGFDESKGKAKTAAYLNAGTTYYVACFNYFLDSETSTLFEPELYRVNLSLSVTQHKHKYTVTTEKYNNFVTLEYYCKECGDSYYKDVYAPKTVSLSHTSYVYNGKDKSPVVTVTDTRGDVIKKDGNYKVKYPTTRKTVGTYIVTITFTGEYASFGKKTASFKVVPKATSIESLTGKSKAVYVKWKKQAVQTTGFEIQYSTKSSMKSAKTITVANKNAVSKTISGLKSKKTYYVRVRAYKTVNKKKYYSSWSKIKSVKTT